MNNYLSEEFKKIKSSFSRVKDDLMHLSSQIHEAYDDMMKKHELLKGEVNFLSSQIKGHTQTLENNKELFSKQQMQHLKDIIKDLKSEVSQVHKEHSHLSIEVNNMKKKKVESRELDGIHEKIHTTETELFLLKERMLEKDFQIKELKEMNKKLFELVDDLTKAELHVLNTSNSKKSTTQKSN